MNISDHTHDADAYIGAGAVYVMPEVTTPHGNPDSSRRAPAIARWIERCAAVAEQVEREALGSPIAQDAARRIKLAILALR